MTLLQARGLTVSGRLNGAAVPVLRDLDLELAPGRVLGLVGESGAGKSMLGRAIAQLLPRHFAVTAGSLAFGGADLVAMPPPPAAPCSAATSPSSRRSRSPRSTRC